MESMMTGEPFLVWGQWLINKVSSNIPMIIFLAILGTLGWLVYKNSTTNGDNNNE